MPLIIPTNLMRVVPKNFHDLAVLTASADPASGFPLNFTQNTIRDRVWRSADTGSSPSARDITIFGLLPRDMDVSFFGMFRHRNYGGKCELKLFSDGAWTTQVYASTALPITTVFSSGYSWGDNPYGLGQQDPFVGEAAFRIWLPSLTTCRSYSITFSHSASPFGYDYWQISRLWLGKYFELLRDPAFGVALGWAESTDGNRNRTLGGSLRTSIPARWRVMKMDLHAMAEIERATWMDIYAYCQTSRDLIVAVYPADADGRRDRDYMLDGKLSALDILGRQEATLTTTLAVEEI